MKVGEIILYYTLVGIGYGIAATLLALFAMFLYSLARDVYEYVRRK